MLFGWGSLCLALLDDAETVVQGRGRTTDKFSSLFVPKLQTITFTTKAVDTDRPSLLGAVL